MLFEKTNYDYQQGSSIINSIKTSTQCFLIDHAHMYFKDPDAMDDFYADFYRIFQHTGDNWKYIEIATKDNDDQWVQLCYSESKKLKNGWETVAGEWLNKPGSFSLIAEEEFLDIFNASAIMSLAPDKNGLLINCRQIRTLKKINGAEDIVRFIP